MLRKCQINQVENADLWVAIFLPFPSFSFACLFIDTTFLAKRTNINAKCYSSDIFYVLTIYFFHVLLIIPFRLINLIKMLRSQPLT